MQLVDRSLGGPVTCRPLKGHSGRKVMLRLAHILVGQLKILQSSFGKVSSMETYNKKEEWRVLMNYGECFHFKYGGQERPH